jgi:hypothetical protein
MSRTVLVLASAFLAVLMGVAVLGSVNARVIR